MTGRLILQLAAGLCLLWLSIPLNSALADYQAGFEAYAYGDYERAMREWMEVAESPSKAEVPTIYAETLYAIGMLYWMGKGVERDFRQAHDWLLKAGKMDHAGAQAKLGFLYTDGNAVPQDFDQAFEWYTRAARGGNVDGQYNLGIFYYYGWGTEQDYTMAAQYLAAASARGDEAAEEALQQVLKIIQGETDGPAGTDPGDDANAGSETPARQSGGEAVPADMAAATPEPAAATVLEDSDWIMQQPPGRYTIQVIALSELEKLEALIEDHAGHMPFAFYPVERSGNTLYVLVQGNYPNVDDARVARDYFPRGIQRTDQLWIRQFSMIQDQIRE